MEVTIETEGASVRIKARGRRLGTLINYATGVMLAVAADEVAPRQAVGFLGGTSLITEIEQREEERGDSDYEDRVRGLRRGRSRRL